MKPPHENKMVPAAPNNKILYRRKEMVREEFRYVLGVENAVDALTLMQEAEFRGIRTSLRKVALGRLELRSRDRRLLHL